MVEYPAMIVLYVIYNGVLVKLVFSVNDRDFSWKIKNSGTSRQCVPFFKEDRTKPFDICFVSNRLWLWSFFNVNYQKEYRHDLLFVCHFFSLNMIWTYSCFWDTRQINSCVCIVADHEVCGHISCILQNKICLVTVILLWYCMFFTLTLHVEVSFVLSYYSFCYLYHFLLWLGLQWILIVLLWKKLF